MNPLIINEIHLHVCVCVCVRVCVYACVRVCVDITPVRERVNNVSVFRQRMLW